MSNYFGQVKVSVFASPFNLSLNKALFMYLPFKVSAGETIMINL